MKHENLFKIYIPEPCHEDWDKMTPNEQGAYCKVCAKTVVDFSDKSDEQIQQFLNENINRKICGRFRVNQIENNREDIPRLKIEKPKFEFPGYLLPVITPFRSAALTMMLFASVALQSCGNLNEDGGDDDRLAGTIALADSSTKYHDRIQGGITADKNRNNVKDSTCIITDEDIKTVGKLKVIQNDSLTTDTSETMLKGEVEPVKLHGIMIKKEDTK